MIDFLKVLAEGDVTSKGLLLLAIFCLITGRLVPYWQVDEMREKLKGYEEKAPQLLKEVEKLIELQKQENKQAELSATKRTGPRVVNRVVTTKPTKRKI